jgi:hypothetical protein
MITDLSNELPLIPRWDPYLVFSPLQVTLPSLKYLHLASARPLADDVPTTEHGREDHFVDDIIRFISDPVQIKRCVVSDPAAIYVAIRPNAGDKEPIER